MLHWLLCYEVQFEIYILRLLIFQTLSSWATSSVEEVASTGPGIRFFQLYVRLITLMVTMLYCPGFCCKFVHCIFIF